LEYKNKQLVEIIKTNNMDPNLKNSTIELENEIQIFREHCNLSEGEKLISITFISVENDINYPIIAKNTDIFLKLESMIYEKYPNFRNTNNSFLVEGNIINPNQTLEQNNIKNNDIITLINN